MKANQMIALADTMESYKKKIKKVKEILRKACNKV